MSLEESVGFTLERSDPGLLGVELLFDSAPWPGLSLEHSFGFSSERSGPGLLGEDEGGAFEVSTLDSTRFFWR